MWRVRYGATVEDRAENLANGNTPPTVAVSAVPTRPSSYTFQYCRGSRLRGGVGTAFLDSKRHRYVENFWKDMARTGERCGGRGGSRVVEWRVKKRKSGCRVGTPSDEAFAAEISTPEFRNLIYFRARIFFPFNLAHNFEISAIKPPHRREKRAHLFLL